ncbi:MAG: PLP-dependent aminotransferase family protein [Acidobacteriota bacterium]
MMIDYQELLSEVGRTLRPNVIRKLTALANSGKVISFAAGAPSVDTFPIAEIAEIAIQTVRDKGKAALQYGATRGLGSLLEGVIAIMAERGVRCSADEVVMTTGSQQGLDLIARLLFSPGDIALVELPSYIGGIIALHNGQARMVGVKQDDDGMVIDDLREKLEQAKAQGRRVKCIYTIPNFQNPSGVTLSFERRKALLALADEYDFLIIEDDPYYELYFAEDATELKPLVAMNRERVIYLSSFSKTLAPGLRTAWVVAPKAFSAKIETLKEGADLSSSVFDQAIVAEAIRSGLVAKRLPEIRRFYQVRRDAMLETLERHAPAGARWTKPVGGFFLWMELAGKVDTTEILPQVIERGIAYVPGQPFFVDDGGTNTLRLAYSKESPERIAEGIEMLCNILKQS